MREAVGEQTAIYEELHRLAFTFADDFVGSLALDYVERLSSGDLRGTNPDNAAHRHNAVMLEAWRLRERGANGPGMRMRPTRRRTATARRSGATARR
jgi:hypothetical protein